MITVSDAWKEKHNDALLPESFVEISCALTEVGVQEEVTPSATTEEIFSMVSAVPGVSGGQTSQKYATFEPNLWVLDGTRNILPTDGPYSNAGYVSRVPEQGSVTLTLPEVHTVAIPGVTIDWSSEYGEYPCEFTVTARNGETVVAEVTVTDNKSSHSLVEMAISDYDSVTVTVNEWCMPNHRTRIDLVRLGLDITFTKNDLLSYSHEQHGCMASGELPKNSIQFSIDNSNSRWNPSNPAGMEQFLSERQRLTVRYGMDINGTIEWIKAGTFYLSEWRAPSNGLEATFVARDIFEYMLTVPYTGIKSGTLREIVDAALEQADLPSGTVVEVDLSPASDYVVSFEEEYTIAEVLQLCANAAGCAMFQDREGVLKIKRVGVILSDYHIRSAHAYSWPEIELSKNLKEVAVSWGENETFILPVNAAGETQTVDNPMIGSAEHAAYVADVVKRQLETRKSVSGEYRSDPRLDLFDCITVDTKFGEISPVVISTITYTFSGAFAGSYTGKVIA